MSYRIGFGIDVHRLVYDKPLWLGGINIPSDKGSVGHSDADVLIHAICDALLGAAGMGDIGYHFPENDPTLKGIDSKLLLEKTMNMLRDEGYQVSNVDSTISLQEPRISPYIPKIREKLSEVMKIREEQISVKATTTERLGYEGSREGITAYAIVLLEKGT